MNQLKTVILLGVMTGLVVGAGYYFGGQNGALIALGLSAIMNLGSYWFSDKIILRLYRAKEIPEREQPELHRTLTRLAQMYQMPKPRLYLVNMPIPNAFATGRNEKHAVVAVTNGILELLDKDELEGVLAHELAHIKNRDILVSSIAATLAGAISYIAQMAYYGGLLFGPADRRGDQGNVFSLLVFVILTPIVATLLHLAISRSREYMADETGAQKAHKAEALARALEKMHNVSKRHPLHAEPKFESTAHLFIINPFKRSLLTALFSTHPPIEERIARLRKMR
ncbi:protease HtpX [Candidatus Peregrinibacteria bacterium CG11_big_fil_rev_8_21_14_0_20_46_8]|nr:MAG: protease HtpX [Candidatus Peregrinibacteria bacterium CG11_big_fil_rev_8_21_14_0_20_46_8]